MGHLFKELKAHIIGKENDPIIYNTKRENEFKKENKKFLESGLEFDVIVDTNNLKAYEFLSDNGLIVCTQKSIDEHIVTTYEGYWNYNGSKRYARLSCDDYIDEKNGCPTTETKLLFRRSLRHPEKYSTKDGIKVTLKDGTVFMGDSKRANAAHTYFTTQWETALAKYNNGMEK